MIAKPALPILGLVTQPDARLQIAARRFKTDASIGVGLMAHCRCQKKIFKQNKSLKSQDVFELFGKKKSAAIEL